MFAKTMRDVDRVFLLTGHTVAMLVQSETFEDEARKTFVQQIVRGHVWCL